MKKTHKLLNPQTAAKMSYIMQIICYLIIGALALVLVLSFFGRLQYDLHSRGESYKDAIYAEDSHDFSSRFLTVSSKDSINISSAEAGGRISIITYIAITITLMMDIVPLLFAYWFLARVFTNVARGEIFVEKNARYLLYYGVIRIVVALVGPFAKLLTVGIANAFVTDTIALATGSDVFNQLIPGAAFLVAAYIIHYGVHLQDEVDHTI